MAANKGKDKLNELFEEIITDIFENGISAISAMKGKMSSKTFYELIENEERLNRYARACEMRAEVMAEEILSIADNQENDVIITKGGDEIINHNVINRSRLRVDSRKWLLSKMNPKKYGDKLGLELPEQINIIWKNKE